MRIDICLNPKVTVEEDFSGKLDKVDNGLKISGEYTSYQTIFIENQSLRITKVIESIDLIADDGKTTIQAFKRVNGYSLKYGSHPVVCGLKLDQIQILVEQLFQLASENDDRLSHSSEDEIVKRVKDVPVQSSPQSPRPKGRRLNECLPFDLKI